MRLAGYAALFGRRDAGRDLIRPGAFARSLAACRDPLPLCWQHRRDVRVGWIEHAAEDARGLRVIAALDDPQGVAARALRHGAVTGLSFGYRARHFRRHAAGRDLIAIDLIEVSLVTLPMQHAARVHLILPPTHSSPSSLGEGDHAQHGGGVFFMPSTHDRAADPSTTFGGPPPQRAGEDLPTATKGPVP